MNVSHLASISDRFSQALPEAHAAYREGGAPYGIPAGITSPADVLDLREVVLVNDGVCIRM